MKASVELHEKGFEQTVRLIDLTDQRNLELISLKSLDATTDERQYTATGKSIHQTD